MRDFGEFEKRLHAKVMGLEREVVKEELERADLDVPDDDASLHSDDPVARIIAEAQSSAGLTAKDAMELAVEETSQSTGRADGPRTVTGPLVIDCNLLVCGVMASRAKSLATSV